MSKPAFKNDCRYSTFDASCSKSVSESMLSVEWNISLFAESSVKAIDLFVICFLDLFTERVYTTIVFSTRGTCPLSFFYESSGSLVLFD